MSGKSWVKRCAAWLTLFALLFLSGCAAVKSIKEDSVYEDLPQIDPEAGLSRDIVSTLYYRLVNEPYLVAIRHSVAVYSDETPEQAIVRTLLSGVPPLSEDVEKPFPEGTEAVEVSRDGEILYITLSEAYLNEPLLQQDEEANREAVYAGRRMGLYAIVNSIAAYDPEARVMVSVERQNGETERLRYDELGMEDALANSGLLEPMAFEESVVATPGSIVECVLRHMRAGEFEAIYDLFAETESGEGQKPAYSQFVSALTGLGRVAEYAVHGYTIRENAVYAVVQADVAFVDEAGNTRRIRHAQLQLKREGDIYRLTYYTFKNTLEGQA